MGAGRPSEFKEEYTQKIEDFFNVDATEIKEIITTGKNDFKKVDLKEFAVNLPTLQKFAYDIKVDRETLLRWSKEGISDEYKGKDKEIKREFSNAYTRAKEKQEAIWLENSLKSLYNPQFAIFLGKNVFGYKDKIESEVKHSGEIKNTGSIIGALTAKKDKVVGN